MNDKKSRPSTLKIAYVGDHVLENPGRYLDGLASMIEKRPETPFPARLGAFWNILQHFLAIIILME